MVENNDRDSSSPKCKVGDDQQPNSHDREFALKYYEIMLGALGSRERQVIQMFAYVAPAMAAMAWIVTTATDNALLLFGGPYILAIILAHGRQHIIRMAYNFRACMLQTGKIEKKTGWKRYVLFKWSERADRAPDDFLPEMFKSQVHILQLAMWAVIVIGALAVLGTVGKGSYYDFPKTTSWARLNGYKIEYILPTVAVIGLLVVGAWMEILCSATLGKLDGDLRKMYGLEEKDKKDGVPSNVPGDICRDPDVPSSDPGDMGDVAESG